MCVMLHLLGNGQNPQISSETFTWQEKGSYCCQLARKCVGVGVNFGTLGTHAALKNTWLGICQLPHAQLIDL